MSKKPMISIARDVTVRRSYSLAEETAVMLDDYAEFLSGFEKTKVTPGDIVQKLAEKLGRDPLFVEWRRGRVGTSAEAGKGAKGSAATAAVAAKASAKTPLRADA